MTLNDDTVQKLTFLAQSETVIIDAFTPLGKDDFITAVKAVWMLMPSEAEILWEITRDRVSE